MRLKIKDLGFSTGGPFVSIIHKDDAKDADLYPGDRISIKKNGKQAISVVDLSDDHKINRGEIGFFDEVLDYLNTKRGYVDINLAKRLKSLGYIRKKLEGKRLEKKEIFEIIKDINNNNLNEVELTYFVSGCYSHGLSMQEIEDLTDAIVKAGHRLNLKKHPIVDKHCLSGDIPVIIRNSSKIKVKKIEDIVDELMDNHKKEVRIIDGAEYLEKNPNCIKVLTFGDDGKVKFAPVTGFFRVKSPDMMQEITLLGNRKIKVTGDHTIFLLKKGKIINIPAKELKKDDFVIVPSGYENSVQPIKEIEVNNLKNRRFKSLNKIKINSEFIRLLAYYIAEGFTNEQGIFLNFGSHEKILIEDAKKCVKEVFGFEPTVNIPHKTAVRVSIYSQITSKLFKDEINVGSNALKKNIPPFIFDLDRKLQLEFLQTLFKGGGHVRRGYEAVYTTVSKQLCYDLQYLLSLLGISVSLSVAKEGKRKYPDEKYHNFSEYYQIYTQAREIFGKREHPNVSFINLLPIKDLGDIDTKQIGWEFRLALRNQSFITKDKAKEYSYIFESSDVRKIINEKLSVLPVKLNEEISSNTRYVYDIYVKEYNKFMAGTAPMAVHNCVGGIPGNRTTMIVVPIISSLGFTMPKTSSRAISSPAGTADTMESLSQVSFDVKEIEKIVEKTNGCIVWGGGVDLASADDKMIKVRNPLRLDPEGLLLASIMAKKKAVNASHVLIDIPVGKGAKVESRREARDLKRKFIELSKDLKIKIKVIITDGKQPIGNGIGPNLEAMDVLNVLNGKGPEDLKNKSIKMSTAILKMLKVKDAKKKAIDSLNSGKAYEKMKEIIKAQKGNIFKPEQLRHGKFKEEIFSGKSGRVKFIDNKNISKIARTAGAPTDKTAGVYLHKKLNDRVKRDELLFIIYSDSEKRLNYAVEIVREKNPYVISSLRIL